MIWLTWRQFRAQALVSLAFLTATAIWLLVTGLRMHHTYGADLASCTLQHDCLDVLSPFQHGYSTEFDFAEILVIAAPGLIGIFWGAPMISRELETGTNQLAWNQSVTRTRWLAAKLCGVGIAALATAGLLGYLMTWWAGPLDHITGSRFGSTTFATRDIVPFGYAAFAFALGTTAGLLLRRTIPAMAVTLGLFVGIQVLMPTTIRPHLLPSTTHTYRIDAATGGEVNGIYTTGGGAAIHLAGLPVPRGVWILSAPPIENTADHVVSAPLFPHCLFLPTTSPIKTKGGGPDVQRAATCLTRYHLHESITYDPAGDYWPLQWYETGLFLALAASLASVCFWQIRRRQN